MNKQFENNNFIDFSVYAMKISLRNKAIIMKNIYPLAQLNFTKFQLFNQNPSDTIANHLKCYIPSTKLSASPIHQRPPNFTPNIVLCCYVTETKQIESVPQTHTECALYTLPRHALSKCTTTRVTKDGGGGGREKTRPAQQSNTRCVGALHNLPSTKTYTTILFILT